MNVRSADSRYLDRVEKVSASWRENVVISWVCHPETQVTKSFYNSVDAADPRDETRRFFSFTATLDRWRHQLMNINELNVLFIFKSLILIVRAHLEAPVDEKT